MRSNFERIGKHIQLINEKNTNLQATELLGINIDKFFMPSVANTVGTNLGNYKIVRKEQFACNRMHVGRDYRIPVALSNSDNPFIVSPAYDVFEIIDTTVLLPEYLMMWFLRKEFDRNAWFFTDADVRGGLPWDSFCNIELPVPSIKKQQEIIHEYKTIEQRIKLNEQIIQKLELCAKTLFMNWFIESKSTKEELGSYIDTNPRLTLKKSILAPYIDMNSLSETSMCVKQVQFREYQGGSKFQNGDTLLARITPCLENGKTAFINDLDTDTIGAGSTEFIVMRAKKNVSPYWVYCLAREEGFRMHAIRSMIGSSGRQRVHESYLKEFSVCKPDDKLMDRFHQTCKSVFKSVRLLSKENEKLELFKHHLISKIATIKN